MKTRRELLVGSAAIATVVSYPSAKAKSKWRGYDILSVSGDDGVLYWVPGLGRHVKIIEE